MFSEVVPLILGMVRTSAGCPPALASLVAPLESQFGESLPKDFGGEIADAMKQAIQGSLSPAGSTLLNDDIAQVSLAPLLSEIATAWHGGSPATVNPEVLGVFYLRLLLKGDGLVEELRDALPQILPVPEIGHVVDASLFLDLMPELRRPIERRLLPLHRGIAQMVTGWRGRSETLARMGYASLRHVLRLGHEAMTTEPVLLLGETGTGKELAARIIHELGPRAGRTFVAVNCGGIPDDLAYSLLFGHRKGSFTGATSDVAGAFVAAKGGTVFLDEIGELSLRNQALLLRALGEKKVMPLGAHEEVSVDFRLVAATNRDIQAMVERGEFRADLFYRLRGDWAIRLRPLREYSDKDLAALWHALVEEASKKAKISVSKRTLRPADIEMLRKRPWPGNIRQLATFAQKYVEWMAGGLIAPDLVSFFEDIDAAFSPKTPSSSEGWPDRETVQKALAVVPERGLDGLLGALREKVVSSCLEQEGDDQTRAAARLGMKPGTLRAYISRHRPRDVSSASPTSGEPNSNDRDC